LWKKEADNFIPVNINETGQNMDIFVEEYVELKNNLKS